MEGMECRVSVVGVSLLELVVSLLYTGVVSVVTHSVAENTMESSGVRVAGVSFSEQVVYFL